MTDIFQDASEAAKLACDNKDICELMDMNFPLEEALIPPLIELTLKDLLGAAYRPKDEENDAKDDLAQVAMKK